MKRMGCGSEPCSCGNSQETRDAHRGIDGAEQGHDWKQHECLNEHNNVANALLFSLAPAASPLICKGRSDKEVI